MAAKTRRAKTMPMERILVLAAASLSMVKIARLFSR
jgi:hypothetical protein